MPASPPPSGTPALLSASVAALPDGRRAAVDVVRELALEGRPAVGPAGSGPSGRRSPAIARRAARRPPSPEEVDAGGTRWLGQWAPHHRPGATMDLIEIKQKERVSREE